MIRNVTFSADDIEQIEAINDTSAEMQEYISQLKDVVKELSVDETIELDLSDELIQAAELACNELPDQSGILCHIYCMFNDS